MLVVLLLTLGAASASMLATRDHAAMSLILQSLLPISLVTAAVAIGIALDERGFGLRFQKRVMSYQDLLNDHFLVSKFDAEGRFCEGSANFLNLTGYRREELLGQSIGHVAGQNFSTELRAQMWQTVSNGTTWSGEFCHQTKDGSQVWLNAAVVPWMGPRGGLEYVMVVGVDVTEQRSAQIELKRTHAQLEAFVTHAPAAVAMFDRDMRYVVHTDRWVQDYNLKQRSLVGQHHYDVFPEIPEHWRIKHRRILEGATERCEEERFVRADGTENTLRWEVRPWYCHDGEVGGIIMLTEEISERKKIENKLWELAKLDGLTGLPNRFLFNESLRDALATAATQGTELGVALIDLDHFKEVNDTLGHDAGDEMLRDVARRLQASIEGRGLVARLGGDEFAVVVDGRAGCTDGILETVRDVETLLMQPISLEGSWRSCSGSIGVTLFPRDGTLQSDLLKNADLALYRAKSLGRGRTTVFSSDLRSTIDRRKELQRCAFDAIRDGQFELYFQPVVPVAANEPLSFEALLRWNHPVHGVMSPPMFEEIMDEPRIAAALGERVVDLALAQAARWQAEGVSFGRIAVNVATADFSFGCFAERLQAKFAQYNVAPQKICIEVTERVFLGAGALHVGTALHALDAMGVEIALDDFGTGYASLSHVKTYPIGRLKIDRSFVMDMVNSRDSLSIVQAIVHLSQSLGLRVTAEGVEDEEQLTLLKAIGCTSLQGYYFARPMPADQILRAVQGFTRAA